MTVKKISLGRMAVFLIPSMKLEMDDGTGRTFRDVIHAFLLERYAAYTVQAGNIAGHWKDSSGKPVYDEHRLYKVAFAGKERIPALEAFLAKLARLMREDCIYFETGEDSWLIYAEEERTQGKKVRKKP